MDLAKAPSATRPAKGELDLVRLTARRQALEDAVAVCLQDAPELGRAGGRVRALAVLGVEVVHRRRGAAVPGSIIDRIAPQPPGLGPTYPDAQGRAVELDPLPGEDPRLPVGREEVGVLGGQCSA